MVVRKRLMPEPTQRPPIAAQPLSLLLVAHNAAAHIEAVLANWIGVLGRLNRPYEILVIDDGSTDDTAMLADMLASRHARLRVVHHASRQGFGAALRSGLPGAQYPLLAYTTCDRQYDPADLQRLLDQIDKVDLVTGYRLWLPVPLPLRWLGRAYRLFVRVVFGIALDPLPCWLGDHGQSKRWLARWVFGVRVHDVECAFRLFRRTIFARIPVQSHGPFAQVEILAKANFLGCWMAEAPVTYRPPAGPAVHGSLTRRDTFLSEAYRLFSEPNFGPAVLTPSGPPDPSAAAHPQTTPVQPA
jgi:glycosyltransferase involved in cell wall biosynthesis